MKGHFGGEEASTMKEHFIMKGLFIRKRELDDEKIIRKNNIVFDKRIVLLGKESSTI